MNYGRENHCFAKFYYSVNEGFIYHRQTFSLSVCVHISTKVNFVLCKLYHSLDCKRGNIENRSLAINFRQNRWSLVKFRQLPSQSRLSCHSLDINGRILRAYRIVLHSSVFSALHSKYPSLMSFRHSPGRLYNISSDSDKLSPRRGREERVARCTCNIDESRVLSFPYRYLSYIFSLWHSPLSFLPSSQHTHTHTHLSFNQHETLFSVSSSVVLFLRRCCASSFSHHLSHLPPPISSVLTHP